MTKPNLTESVQTFPSFEDFLSHLLGVGVAGQETIVQPEAVVTKNELDFAPGDIVQCVDNVGYEDELVNGDTYEVSGFSLLFSAPMIQLAGMSGHFYAADRFRLFKQADGEENIIHSEADSSTIAFLRNENGELATANADLERINQALHTRINELHTRVSDLLGANNREVERRRQAERQVEVLSDLSARLLIGIMFGSEALKHLPESV